jgi:hypothetical protein
MNTSQLKKLVKTLVAEISLKDISGAVSCIGSTHTLKTCNIGNGKFFMKFGDDNLFDNLNDANLQVGVEYLAYAIYKLYPGVSTPSDIHVVSDDVKRRIGLATSAVEGETGSYVPVKSLAKLLTAGVFVDVFLANWDIGNTANVIVSPDHEDAVRIDPGGALTFRAQGSRKGDKFNTKAGELRSMFDPSTGAGRIFRYADAQKAAETFMKASWPSIDSRITEAAKAVAVEVQAAGLPQEPWDDEVSTIRSILQVRHKVVSAHCEFVLGSTEG